MRLLYLWSRREQVELTKTKGWQKLRRNIQILFWGNCAFMTNTCGLFGQRAEKHIMRTCTSADWDLLRNSIYCTSALEMLCSCRKDPNSTESVEEAALKAWGPMPCALLIVTSAFLSSNSDWWVCQGRRAGAGGRGGGGGDILQRRRGASGGGKLCLKVPFLLSEGWHGASRDSGPLVLWVWTLA